MPSRTKILACHGFYMKERNWLNHFNVFLANWHCCFSLPHGFSEKISTSFNLIYKHSQTTGNCTSNNNNNNNNNNNMFISAFL